MLFLTFDCQSAALLCFSYRFTVSVRHSYASFAFLTPVGAPADMYFTPLASGGGPATYFLFLEVSAEALRLFFDFFPHCDLSRTRVSYI